MDSIQQKYCNFATKKNNLTNKYYLIILFSKKHCTSTIFFVYLQLYLTIEI